MGGGAVSQDACSIQPNKVRLAEHARFESAALSVVVVNELLGDFIWGLESVVLPDRVALAIRRDLAVFHVVFVAQVAANIVVSVGASFLLLPVKEHVPLDRCGGTPLRRIFKPRARCLDRDVLVRLKNRIDAQFVPVALAHVMQVMSYGLIVRDDVTVSF